MPVAYPPATPPRVLRVGVTGHRNLGPYDPEEIASRARTALERVRAVCALLVAPQAPRLVLISALAKGADQLVADAALSLGFELQCPLPFFVEDYRQDFPPGTPERSAFERLLAQATAVLELNGDPGPEVGDQGADPRSPVTNAGYELVGRTVLTQCDALLAVWDGSPARGRGGTGSVVEQAMLAGIPTVVVPPTAGAVPRLLVVERDGGRSEKSLEDLPAHLVELIRPDRVPAADIPGKDPSRHGGGGDTLAHHRAQAAQYARFLDETRRWKVPSPGRCAGALLGSLWPAILRGVSDRPLEASETPPACDPRSPAAPPLPLPPERGDGTSRGAPKRIMGVFRAHHDWVEGLASHYASLYRSAFVLNYALGALAVGLALASGLQIVHGLLHAAGPNGGPHASPTFVVLELGSIGLILLMVFLGSRGRWHEKAVSYRILAEHLRCMIYLAPLGLDVPYSRPPPYAGRAGDLRSTWMNWHYRRILRDAGMPHARFDRDYLTAARDRIKREWVLEQCDYHGRNHARLHRAHHRAEAAALVAVLVALVACVLHLLPDAWIGGLFGHANVSWAHAWLSALAAGLPALAAALHGIDEQAEFERLSLRSGAMRGWLASVHASLEAAPLPDRSAVGPALLGSVRSISEQMINEVNDWQVLYRTGDIKVT